MEKGKLKVTRGKNGTKNDRILEKKIRIKETRDHRRSEAYKDIA